MASIRNEFVVEASAAQVWDAVRDFGAVHQRLAPGFVVDTKLEGDTRVVTFGNGATARERLVDIDDAKRRLVYGVVDGRFTHDNATVEIIEEGENRCRFIWQRDMLPNELAPAIRGMMDQGAEVMRRALSRTR